MNPSLAAQLLNPKAAAKEKSKKRQPLYGFQFRWPFNSQNPTSGNSDFGMGNQQSRPPIAQQPAFVDPQQLAAGPPAQYQHLDTSQPEYGLNYPHQVPEPPPRRSGRQGEPAAMHRSMRKPASFGVPPYQQNSPPDDSPPRRSIQPAQRFSPPSPSTPSQHASYGQEEPEVHDLTEAGPKQSRKPTPVSDDARATIRQFDPKALLNPKGANTATNGTSTADASVADQDDRPLAGEDGEGRGMSYFMPDLHRTTNRDSVPQRKRKSQAGDDDNGEGTPESKKAKFSGFASGGTLGEDMRKERERIGAESGPSTAPIDLTGDDNSSTTDDVTFVRETPKDGSNLNEEVCIGVIQAKANISRIPVFGGRFFTALPKEFWPRLRLDYRREVSQHHKIELLDRKQRVCGYIELRIASALCPLLDGQAVNRTRLSVYLNQHRRAHNEEMGQAVSKNLNLSIAMYAPRRHTDRIGKYLSQKQIFLSSPSRAGIATGKEVQNPHEPANFGPRGLQGERRPQTSQPAVVRTEEEMRIAANNMFDALVKHDDLPEMEADHSIIKTGLLAHQKQGLRFMTDHERTATSSDDERVFSLWKPTTDKRGSQTWVHVVTGQVVMQEPHPVLGGILADMMGLGKTLSILSLVAQTKSDAEAFGEEDVPIDASFERSVKGTLIICPKSVMTNWQEQILAHTKRNKLTYYNYHGSNRTQDVDELAEYDVVLTTYNTAAADFNAKNRALRAVSWFRIVLDEAHGIRNQSTAVAKAACDLVAQRRWAVTGTPVQNGLNDLGALIKFLQIKPFDDAHVWSQYVIAPLKSGNTNAITHLRLLVDSITLRRLKDKIDIASRKEVEVRLDFPESDRRIYSNIAGTSRKEFNLMTGGGEGKLNGKAYAHILKSLNRMRMFCAHGLDMFGEEDRKDIAEGMNPDSAIAIDLGDEPDKEVYNFVTEKQAYEHLHLVNETDTDRCEKCGGKIGDDKAEAADAVDSSGDDSDSSAPEQEPRDDVLGYLNPCFHLFCPKCKPSYVTQAESTLTADHRHECPCCMTYVRLGLFEFRRTGLHEFLRAKEANIKKRRGKKWDATSYNGPSAKVCALLEDLRKSAAETDMLPEDEPPIRSVVFSGWTTYLDLIQVALEDNEIGYVRLDGTMSVRQRSRVLEQFKTDPSVTILLVSIKAGGQGLNFTAANKVYMMEPQYNPGVEQQAIDRVHRLGQVRDVHITHYIMNDSVEESILKLQLRKEDLAKFALEKKLSKQDEAKKRIEHLRDLFR